MKIREYLTENDDFIIYCDMDGVLCDMNRDSESLKKGITKHWGKGPKEEKKAWDIILAEGEKFWEFMHWKTGGKELWNYIKQYNSWILSAAARGTDMIISGKMKWIKRELGSSQVKQSIICYNAKEKKKYAIPNGILIDDYEKNVSDWRKGGGIAILHKNTKDTLKQLKEIIGNV